MTDISEVCLTSWCHDAISQKQSGSWRYATWNLYIATANRVYDFMKLKFN
jgi:hypothetical protein